jgi:hypothetical protein
MSSLRIELWGPEKLVKLVTYILFAKKHVLISELIKVLRTNLHIAQGHSIELNGDCEYRCRRTEWIVVSNRAIG